MFKGRKPRNRWFYPGGYKPPLKAMLSPLTPMHRENPTALRVGKRGRVYNAAGKQIAGPVTAWLDLADAKTHRRH